MQIICAPLGWLMRLAFSLTGNYGLAIIVFTLMTKVVLFPVSLWVHSNGIKMVRLEPAVNLALDTLELLVGGAQVRLLFFEYRIGCRLRRSVHRLSRSIVDYRVSAAKTR